MEILSSFPERDRIDQIVNNYINYKLVWDNKSSKSNSISSNKRKCKLLEKLHNRWVDECEDLRCDLDKVSQKVRQLQSEQSRFKTYRPSVLVYAFVAVYSILSVIVTVLFAIGVSRNFAVLAAFSLFCLGVLCTFLLSYLIDDYVKKQICLLSLHIDRKLQEYRDLKLDLDNADLKARMYGVELKESLQDYEDLLGKDVDYQNFVRAKAEYNRIRKLCQSEKYKLLTSDWRSFRGVKFEKFLQRVFHLHGYDVHTTKGSGDQGVDLILYNKGPQVAIQAKGYSGSVGNAAVQQAHTGAVYYECQSYAVITNSTFTSSARKLAERVGCTLIDGSQIPALIEGKIRI